MNVKHTANLKPYLSKALKRYDMPMSNVAMKVRETLAVLSSHKMGVNKTPVDSAIEYSALFNDAEFNDQVASEYFGTPRPYHNQKWRPKYHEDIFAVFHQQEKEELERKAIQPKIMDEILIGDYRHIEQYCREYLEEEAAENRSIQLIADEGGIDLVKLRNEVNKRNEVI